MASPLASTFSRLDPCSGDSPEDLRCKLLYASLELQKIRAKGRLQETELWRLQELLSIMKKERDEALEECRRLQECVFLQQTPAMGVDSASSFMHSSSMVSSPSSSPWSLQELEEHLNSDDFCPAAAAPTPSELQQALESLIQSCDKGQSVFSQMKVPGDENALFDSEQEMQMNILDQALCFDTPPCLNLPELQVNDERVTAVSPSVRSLSRQSSSNSSSACVQHFQKRQVSMESLDAVVGLSSGMAKSIPAISMAGMVSNVPPPSSSMGSNAVYGTQQISPIASLVATSGSTLADESLLLMSKRGSCGLMSNNGMTSSNTSSVTHHTSSPGPSICENGASVAMDVSAPKLCLSNNELPTNISAQCFTPGNAESVSSLMNTSSPLRSLMGIKAPPLASARMVKSVACSTASSMTENMALTTSASLAQASPTEPVPASKATSISSASCYLPQVTCSPVRQCHLPEPPEADPQVMLNSLPEKGKLLQAVMQAGPLLQTLLLAGPLPQWRYPPPAISTRDIPKVSLAPGHVLFSPSSVQGAVGCNTMMYNGSPSAITRKRIAIMEPCLQNKKLRKLSPSPPRKGQAIRMVSGGGERQRLASGSLSQLAAS